MDNEREAKIIAEAMSFLTPRQRRVVELRILCDTKTRLEDVAKELDVSKERVRQIETRALEKLKGVAEALNVL
jgi:RNA polymerase sigma-32 factor